jgi:hypothetical protein
MLGGGVYVCHNSHLSHRFPNRFPIAPPDEFKVITIAPAPTKDYDSHRPASNYQENHRLPTWRG